jgi:protein-arginine kinase activator protein McsA
MFIFSTKGYEDSCPVCGFKMSDFIVQQRMGCSFCYLFLPKASKNLVQAVQDGNTIHDGKRNGITNSLIRNFLMYAIDQEIKKNPEEENTCEELKAILDDYF